MPSIAVERAAGTHCATLAWKPSKTEVGLQNPRGSRVKPALYESQGSNVDVTAAAGQAKSQRSHVTGRLGIYAFCPVSLFPRGNKTMANALPKGWHTVTPRLVAQDAAKLVRFLKDAFGASGEYREDVPSLMTIGDSIVMVSGAGRRRALASFLYLYVEDTDDTYRRALKAGAISVEAPLETPYGDRRAMITDPCGNEWQIATHER